MNSLLKERPVLCDSAIVRVATQLMLEQGYSAMSMRTLARTLGVHAGSLYYHFPGKRELLEQVLTSVLQERLDAWQAFKPALGGVLDQFDAFVLFHLRRSIEFGGEERLVEREMRHIDEASQYQLNKLHARYVGELSEIITHGIEKELFQVCNIDLITQCMLSMLSGVIIAMGSEAVTDRSLTDPVAMLCRKLVQVRH
jgi:AcrR family transcriptional regulator